MHFTKMQGLGNDYLFYFGAVPQTIASITKKISDRHFGIGSDGVICITPSVAADFGMRIFNADGSEAKMCGNGIRCVGKYVFDKRYTEKTELQIETLSGIRRLLLHTESGIVKSVTVDMGKATVENAVSLVLENGISTGVPVSVGNPHFVVFCENAETAPLSENGAKIERHPRFPDGVNVEYVHVADDHTLRMRVWERGSGITMACGTGACASVAAAVARELFPVDTAVSVILDGGILTVCVHADGEISMTGIAETVCECDIPV